MGGRADGSGSSLGWLQVVSFNPQSWDASLRFCSYFQDPLAAVTQYRYSFCPSLDVLCASHCTDGESELLRLHLGLSP